MTTEDTITDAQIEAIRNEAYKHGDYDMVAICDSALNSASPAMWLEARAECAQMINDAAAHAASL
tara:strand:+ start:434 stop:628 length:195 start_codon:yes stop_codon:yes gene_type:complete